MALNNLQPRGESSAGVTLPKDDLRRAGVEFGDDGLLERPAVSIDYLGAGEFRIVVDPELPK